MLLLQEGNDAFDYTKQSHCRFCQWNLQRYWPGKAGEASADDAVVDDAVVDSENDEADVTLAEVTQRESSPGEPIQLTRNLNTMVYLHCFKSFTLSIQNLWNLWWNQCSQPRVETGKGACTQDRSGKDFFKISL